MDHDRRKAVSDSKFRRGTVGKFIIDGLIFIVRCHCHLVIMPAVEYELVVFHLFVFVLAFCFAHEIV